MAKPRPTTNETDALLLSSGDLASFASLLSLRRPDLTLVAPTTSDPDALRIIERQADLAGARVLDEPIEQASDDFAETRLLLDACSLARANRCTRVVWPIFCAAQVDPIAIALDRARLVSTLAALDARPKGLPIDTPVLDLTEGQLADLAIDVGVPSQPGWLADEHESHWLTLLRAADQRRRQTV
jgi:hypothetical protein